MFNFGKKIEKDPEKALDNARKTLNTGLVGGLTKAFMGKDFVNEMNGAMDQGQAAIDGVKQMQWLAQNGADATAEVVSVADTGATVNMNPVLTIHLKVQPASGAAFETTANTMVSRIAIPRAGDKIRIKFNPDDHAQVLVLG